MSSSASPVLTAEFLAPLRSSLSSSGRVVLPSDADYTACSTSWNHDFQGRPTFIVWLSCTEDVVAAVKFLRLHSLPFTVGGGFHSRYSLRSGHVLLSLGGMRQVRLDSARQVASVQGGCRNEDLDAECANYHLHTTLGTNPDTGVGGLILGGGIGYLARKHGLSIDNLTHVQLVNAQGDVLQVDDTHHPDLFWAVKGAGFNFGIVTQFTLRLHKVGHPRRQLTEDDDAIASRYGLPAQEHMEHLMVQGVLPYPLEAFTHLVQVMEDRWVGLGAKGPYGDQNVFAAPVLAHGPHGPAAIVQFAYMGDVYEGYRVLEKLIGDLGKPLAPVQATIKVGQ
jgi:FAD/FMN-containing dehydrogenase